MPRAYSEDLRWLVVFKRLVLGLPWSDVQEDLGDRFCRKTQRDILKRFEDTTSVATHQGRRPGPPANQVFDAAHDLFLLEQTRLHRSAFHRERSMHVQLATGTPVHILTICRAMQRMLLQRQRVRQHHPLHPLQ